MQMARVVGGRSTSRLWCGDQLKSDCHVKYVDMCGLGEGVLHVGTYGTASGNVEFVLACRQAGRCFSEDRYGWQAVQPGPPVAHPGHEVRCQ